MHRPFFDDAAAARRHDPDTVEGRVFGWLVALGEIRRQLPALHAAAETTVLDAGTAARARLAAPAPAQRLVRRAGERGRAPGVDRRPACWTPTATLDPVLSSDGPLRLEHGRLRLPGLGFVWLAEP